MSSAHDSYANIVSPEKAPEQYLESPSHLHFPSAVCSQALKENPKFYAI